MKKENGFGLAYTLAGIVVVVALVVVGILVYNHNHNKRTTGSTSSQQSTKNTTNNNQTHTPDPYAGWNSFSLPSSTIKVRYPTDWSIVSSGYDTGVSPTTYTIRLASGTSYNGDKFYLRVYHVALSSYTSTCGITCTVDNVLNIQINGNSYKLVEASNSSGIYQIFVTDDQSIQSGQTNVRNVIKISDGYLSASGGYGEQREVSVPSDTFNSQKEVQTAKLIFAGITF